MWVIFVSIVTLVFEQQTEAYINPFLSAFTNVCCYQILLCKFRTAACGCVTLSS